MCATIVIREGGRSERETRGKNFRMKLDARKMIKNALLNVQVEFTINTTINPVEKTINERL